MRSRQHRSIPVVSQLELALGVAYRRQPGQRHRTVDCNRARCRPVKPIEDVQISDLVWAWNEAEGQLVKRRVTRLFRHQGQRVLRVAYAGAHTTVQSVASTSEHPFWVEGRGWVPADELKRGDVLRRIEGLDAGHDVIRVLQVVDASTADVFNFEVDGLHNYFVGRHGILVHNQSSLDSGDGPPTADHVPGPDLNFTPFILMDQLGLPTRAQTARLVSRVALGVSLLMAGKHMAQKYGGAYSEAVANARAIDADATARAAEAGSQNERLRAARDADLAAEPLVLRSRSQFGGVPAKVTGRGFLGIFPKYGELTSAHDFEIVDAKIRQQLRQGEWRGAQGLAKDADIGLHRYNELVDEAYAPKHSPYKIAAQALMTDWQFQADLADVGGRALTASPYGSVPGLNGVMQRGGMAVTSALWIGYGLSESIDIARSGAGGWSGATSYAEAWRKPMFEMAKRGVYNMAAEHAGMLLPAPGLRLEQSLGRWSMQPDVWGSAAVQYAGMAATDTALGVIGRQGIQWWAHSVDPTMAAPFSDGFLATVVPDAVANGIGYSLLFPGFTSRMGLRSVPWEGRALVLTGARYTANEVYNGLTAP